MNFKKLFYESIIDISDMCKYIYIYIAFYTIISISVISVDTLGTSKFRHE